MAIPKFEDFLFPFMMHLTDQDSNKADMVSVLSDFFNLTEEDKKLKTKGGSSYQIYDRIGWSLQWLRRAQFVEIPEKGIWRITQRGRDYMKHASDLRESDLLKYPEFAEYSGRRNERVRQPKSPSKKISSGIDSHNENWKEIVEELNSALLENTSFHLYFNSVISCLRLLGWKKSNGTIRIELSNAQSDGLHHFTLVHENDKHAIPCAVLKSNDNSGLAPTRDSIDLLLNGINSQIGILFGTCIEIFFKHTEKENPSCIARIELDSAESLGVHLCNLLEYSTFNYNKFTAFCKQLLKENPDKEVVLAKRIKEITTDSNFISSKIEEVLLTEGYDTSLISDFISTHSFKIKIKMRDRHQMSKENTDSVSGTHDNTKFSLDGKNYLNKRGFVLAVIKRYVSDHPHITYKELESQFPSETHSKKRGVIRPLYIVEAWIKENPDLKKRYFMSEGDVIQLYDGTRVVVNNQWGTHFPKFLKIAQTLYSIQSDQPYSGLEDAVISPVEQGNQTGIKISADSFSKFSQKK